MGRTRECVAIPRGFVGPRAGRGSGRRAVRHPIACQRDLSFSQGLARVEAAQGQLRQQSLQ